MNSDRDLTPEEVRRHLQERMATEGALLAYETAIGICRDPKASATAKASALKALLFVGGYDGKPPPDRDKPVSEMTRPEIDAMITQLKRENAAAQTDVGLPDVFA
ncbi:hypothetical protein [Methylobacterium iners]|uniref:Uncharacterized protein n=1 Tax=Methylobacterium iners TaxID=418707 RepID=A0ABQ4S409_9HYPH|nr:hypothetical protein [Methylobacterium iners]GJD96543.1 hypothetical protein OCOJLMKI_3765 [Methylobacterium iners]